MTCAHLSLPSRRDATVRRIVASWRRLTGGSAVRDPDRRTLVACSGGADSSALLLALSSVRPGPTAAHVLHDLRTPQQAEADRDRTRTLCDALGIDLLEGEARVSGEPGNTEANARRERYHALAALAESAGFAWVATGHHADDQLETVLMRLIRGAGPRGLAGILPVRGLSPAVRLVRPMLDITRADAEDLCRRCGWQWAEDHTNRDISRTRAAIRRTVTPALREVEPGAARSASRSASAVRSAHRAVSARALACKKYGTRTGDTVRFDRDFLRSEPTAVLSALIMLMHTSKLGGNRRDRLGQSVLSACIGVIRDENGGERSLDVAGLKMVVTRDEVAFT